MTRLAFLIGFSYLTALFFSSYLPASTLLYAAGGAVFVFLICLLIPSIRKEKIFFVCILTCFAAILVNFHTYYFSILPTLKFQNTDATITAKIVDLPYKKENNYNYIMQVEEVNGEKVKNFKTKVSSSEPLEADVYDTFTGKVHFYLPKSTRSFDYEKYYRSKNIYLCCYAYNYLPYDVKFSSNEFNINKEILLLRAKLISCIRSTFPEKLANVMNGFLLGEKHNFPDDIKNNFDRIGVYHLISTSGIHVCILNSFLLKILRKMKLGNKISVLISCAAILFFMTLTCFTPSVMRAGIMMIIYNLGTIFFRKSDSLNSLGVAIIAIILPNPNVALGINIWLSVLASMGIILNQKKIKKLICAKLNVSLQNKFCKYLIENISVSISVSLFTLPVIIWFFKKTSLIFIFSNLIMIPLSSLLLNSLMIFQPLSCFGAPKVIVKSIAFICEFFAQIIVYVSEILAKIPFALISLDYGYVNLCVALSLVLIAVSILFTNYKKMLKLALILSLMLHVTGAVSYAFFNFSLTRISVLNCSKGLAIVISKGLQKALILYQNNKFQTAELNRELLKFEGFNLDYLLLGSCPTSQQDYTEKLISNFNPKLILAEKSVILKGNSKITYFENKSSTALWGNINIETFKSGEKNFAFIETEKVKILLCPEGGDASKLAKKHQTCDFLIAAALPINYEKIKTKNIIISSSKQDSDILIQKLLNTNIKLFSSAYNENIYIDLDKESYKIKEFC